MANQNRVSTGLSSLARTGRVPTKLPGATYIRRQVRRQARLAADEFTALYGRPPGVHEALALKAMARAEARAQLHERLLAVEWDDLTHEQKCASLSAVAAAGDQIIRMSKEAGLNRRTDAGNLQERLRLIQARTAAQDASTPAPEANSSPRPADAAGEQPGDVAPDGAGETEVQFADGPPGKDSPVDTRGP